MTTYLDIRTGETKPRHTDYGARPFTVAETIWRPATQEQLFSALESARKGNGGEIHLQGIIDVEATVKLPSRTKLIGGGIRAADGFKGSHLIEARGVTNVWLDGVDIDAAGHELITFPIMNESRNIVVVRCQIHDGKTGIAISKGSSDITIYACQSYGHTTWHGIAIQHTNCENIFIGACEFYGNAAYGLDSHGTHVEVAGCNVFDNGRDVDGYEGGCSKYPEAVDHWIHDSTFENDGGGGYGCVWTYGDPGKGQRKPSGVRVYRCDLIGSPHYRANEGAAIDYCDNRHMRRVDGQPQLASPVQAGPGRMVEDLNLREMPTDVDDRTQPVPEPEPEPEPGPELTEADVERIAARVFDEKLKSLQIDVELSYE